MITVSARQLRRAADIQDQIESLQNELIRLLGNTEGSVASRKRRKMSAAARARIGVAMKARWARRLGVKAAKPKRKLSVAARKHLAQLAKARWAKARAAGRKRL